MCRLYALRRRVDISEKPDDISRVLRSSTWTHSIFFILESQKHCAMHEREKEGDELFGFGFECTLFRLTSMCVVVGNCFAIVFEFYCRSAALRHTRPTPRGRRTGGNFSLVSFLSQLPFLCRPRQQRRS